MGYVTKEMIDRAKEMDLLTYLQTYEPQELVHFGGSTYCTREHDSLKISNGKWCWFSRGIGGKTALDSRHAADHDRQNGADAGAKPHGSAKGNRKGAMSHGKTGYACIDP